MGIDLTKEQKQQIPQLFKIILNQSKLFPKVEPFLIKIPFSTLTIYGISSKEAMYLVEYVNGRIQKSGSCLCILNGKISRDDKALGISLLTSARGDFETLDGVDIDEDKDSLILWVKDLEIIKAKIEKALNVDISKINLEPINRKQLTLEINPITLLVSEERKEIWIKDNKKFKYSFRIVHGKNMRFKYLVTIFKKPKISAHNLSETTYQNLSKEIRELNKNIMDRLKLSDDLIINEGSSGYEINPKYHIEFV